MAVQLRWAEDGTGPGGDVPSKAKARPLSQEFKQLTGFLSFQPRASPRLSEFHCSAGRLVLGLASWLGPALRLSNEAADKPATTSGRAYEDARQAYVSFFDKP